MKHFFIHCLEAMRWRCEGWRDQAALLLAWGRRWLGPPRARGWAGVDLNDTGWWVVQPVPVEAVQRSRQTPGDERSDWREDIITLTPAPMPHFRVPLWAEPLPKEELDLWRLAFQSVRRALSSPTGHLVLVWPDDALWSATFTLTGPATADELQTWLLEELEAVLPGPLDEVAWDCRWPAGSTGQIAASGLAHTPWWWRWLSGTRSGSRQAHWEGSVTVTCWALPRHLARGLARLALREGFDSLSVEPRAVAWERANRLATAGAPFAITPQGITAWGAACRGQGEGPNLLRRQRLPLWWRMRMLAPGYLPWLVALTVTSSLGWVWGTAQADAWHRSAQSLEQRLRQLQSQSEQRNQAHQRQQQVKQQALERVTQQQARMTHNAQFAHALQGLAATLPGGVRWQQWDLQPSQLELRAQALDADEMAQWLAQWPRVLPAGGQSNLAWQVLPTVSTVDTPGRMASGATSASPSLAFQVNVHWPVATGGAE